LKRNADLLRAILLEVEESPIFNGRKKEVFDFNIEGYTANEVHFHVHMLIRSKLLDAEEHEDGFIGHGLTLAGHDYLDTIRHSAAWRVTRTKTRDAIMCVGKMLGEIVTSMLRQMLSDHLGGRHIL
jgi:hypothetical protein